MICYRLIAATAAALVAGCAQTAAPPVPKTCAVSGIDRVGGPVTLVDSTGAAVTQAAFADKPTLLYFGFANCPDICPTSLVTAAAALGARKPDAPPLNVALVTLDPERDTPEQMARYVANDAFPPGLVGLTGTAEQIDAAKAAFKVYGQRREDPGSAADYVIDHSSLFYLMDADWKPAAVFPSDLAPEAMAACIDHALAE
ncbi:MAG: SCO family protein [Hyphomonadaceae bacterium]|nr:SCO family protein [Hyphomonadaceae bacterium]